MQTFHFQGFPAFTDNEFGASASDIDNQAASIVTGNALGHTDVNQPGFLSSGNDVYAASKRRFGNHQEGIGILHSAKGLGAHRAQIVRGDFPQALTESGETAECALLHIRIQCAIRVETPAQSDHFFNSIEGTQFTMLSPRHQQMKAVAAKIYGCIGVLLFG